MEIGRISDNSQIPAAKQDNGQIINQLNPSELVAIDSIDNEQTYAKPLMEKLVNFCKSNKFVPEEVRTSAIEYDRVASAFYKKWGNVTSDTSSPPTLIWRLFNPKKYNDYKENYTKEESEFYAARRNLLTKFTNWGKNLIPSGFLPDKYYVIYKLFPYGSNIYREAHWLRCSLEELIKLCTEEKDVSAKFTASIENLKKSGYMVNDISAEKLIELYVLLDKIDYTKLFLLPGRKISS